jgi:chemotaxis-related protein WspB
MLFLPFFAHDNQYVLPAGEIVEVLPCVRLRTIPQTPEYVTGVFNYRGLIVPVIDIGMLLHERPCETLLGTRIILVYYAAGGQTNILGLLAERVTRLITADPSAFSSSGIASERACVGKILTNGPDIVQLVRTESIIPDELQSVLFAEQRVGEV